MNKRYLMKKGICILKCGNGDIHGVVHLIESSKGLIFKVHIREIEPGLHGFHVHKKGNELEGSKLLCEHFNPSNKNHGGLNEYNSHDGDLGNIFAFPSEKYYGEVKTRIISRKLFLKGKNSIYGRSLVVHKNQDDLGKGGKFDSLTTGHSGKRILWGIIGVA